jgi:hypothetical protein
VPIIAAANRLRLNGAGSSPLSFATTLRSNREDANRFRVLLKATSDTPTRPERQKKIKGACEQGKKNKTRVRKFFFFVVGIPAGGEGGKEQSKIKNKSYVQPVAG